MRQFIRHTARIATAVALTASTLTAQATLVEDHILVDRLFGIDLPEGYERAYSIQLGTGSWPYPYVNFYVDIAEEKISYANISAGPSYLTYIQSVNIVQVKAGDEISARTLSDGSLPSFVKITRYSYEHPELNEAYQFHPLTSATGTDPDIYLGFSYTDNQGLNPTYGWAHLSYTRVAGLILVSSAMTMSDSGIVALTSTTIPSVPEINTPAMLGIGMFGIIGLQAARRRKPVNRG